RGWGVGRGAGGRCGGGRATLGAALASAGRVPPADPDNSKWQHDLAVAHGMIGDVLVEQGKLDEALTNYREAVAVGERLTKADPRDVRLQGAPAGPPNQGGDGFPGPGPPREAPAG